MDRLLVSALAMHIVGQHSLPGKKAFQKLFYLIEKAGVPTDLDFSMHYYGPYSFALADEMFELERAHVLQTSDGSVSAGVVPVSKDVERSLDEYRGTVDRILKQFGQRTGRDLELIATTHLVAERLIQHADRVPSSDVLAAVREEKRGKFRDEEIEKALRELDGIGLLPRGVKAR
jgi:uncharacterized protein YwgA